MVGVLGDGDLVQYQLSYARWAQEKFPESIQMTRLLANLYDLDRQPAKAIAMATVACEMEPNNVENLTLLGKVWVDEDTNKALAFLQSALELDRNAETLSEMGRAFQVRGDAKEARAAYREALQLNPLNTHAWVNLFVLGEDKERLWPYVGLMLSHGLGEYEEYFLAAVLRVARKVGKTVPANWLMLARARLSIMETRRAIKDEKMVLQTGILAWELKQRCSTSEEADSERDQGGIGRWIVSRVSAYVWPRSQWVPEQE